MKEFRPLGGPVSAVPLIGSTNACDTLKTAMCIIACEYINYCGVLGALCVVACAFVHAWWMENFMQTHLKMQAQFHLTDLKPSHMAMTTWQCGTLHLEKPLN